MNTFFLVLFLFISVSSVLSVVQDDFKAEQKKFPRVRAAYLEKEKIILSKLNTVNIKTENLNILFIAFKVESELELWAKTVNAKEYILLEKYNVCKSSGGLGPKKEEGDFQVPEGFYQIDRFNPSSKFYLSLGINYPNLSDKLKSSSNKMGGDIFIHGACETIGCLPMTDDKIKEIYLYALEAKNGGQNNIPVYIFPTRLNDKNFRSLINEYRDKAELISFWASLKAGYDAFYKSKIEITFSVGESGEYLIGKN